MAVHDISKIPAMRWKNLLEDRCPKCGSGIYATDPGVHCKGVGQGCDFFITQERLQELKEKMFAETGDNERKRWKREE